MSRFKLDNVNECLGSIQDHCWEVRANVEDDLPSRVAPDECWKVTVSDRSHGDKACWTVSGKDRCIQAKPQFENDFNTEETGIFKIFGIHIAHEHIYMAVEIRGYDDIPTETYYDAYGSATTQRADGKWVYYPPYPATQIVEVSDIVSGLLPHTVETNAFGFKYIVMDNMDINFDVYYKMDSGFVLMKGLLGASFVESKYYMDGIEAVWTLNDTLIGDGCILMGHEASGLNDPIVFKAKNGSCFSIDVDTLEPTPLSTTDLNYMLTSDLALKTDSLSRFKISTGTGEANAYPDFTPSPVINKYTSIMQNDIVTIGFPQISSETDGGYIRIGQDLEYVFMDEASSGGWSGVGSVGNVVGTDPYNPNIYYSKDIPYPPTLPPAGSYDTSVLMGLDPDRYFDVGGDYTIAYKEEPNPGRVRISAGGHFFAIMNTAVVWFESLHPLVFADNISMRAWNMHSSTGVTDFCYYEGQLFIANGTSTLVVRNTEF